MIDSTIETSTKGVLINNNKEVMGSTEELQSSVSKDTTEDVAATNTETVTLSHDASLESDITEEQIEMSKDNLPSVSFNSESLKTTVDATLADTNVQISTDYLKDDGNALTTEAQIDIAYQEELATSATKTQEPTNSIYHLKWFEWKGEQTPIVTQNENGPCPLLGIANVLILARKIVLPVMQQLISAKQLMEYIGDCILSEAPKQEGNEELILNYQQNMQDAIDIMYKLQTGIDVNVRFCGVADFEFTRECIVFDLLRIALYHGWLVDPQDEDTSKAVGTMTYNQLVEKMLTATEDNAIEGLIIEEFLAQSASQLTYHGLCELNNAVEEEELCVFFRNNHFSTLYKHKGVLFLLVTDQGFLTEPAVIWETLINIEGDGQFVNSNFKSVTLQSNTLTQVQPVKTIAAVTNPTNTSTSSTMSSSPLQLPENMTQEDQDYLIALSLQQEDTSTTSQQQQQQPVDVVLPPFTLDSDHALALKLQEDEDRQALLEQQQQQQQQQPRQNTQSTQNISNSYQSRNSSQRNNADLDQNNQEKDKNCSIL